MSASALHFFCTGNSRQAAAGTRRITRFGGSDARCEASSRSGSAIGRIQSSGASEASASGWPNSDSDAWMASSSGDKSNTSATQALWAFDTACNPTNGNGLGSGAEIKISEWFVRAILVQLLIQGNQNAMAYRHLSI